MNNLNVSALRLASLSTSWFPPAPTVWTQLIIIFSAALCCGGMVLWSAKVPKALCQSSNEPFARSHTHQKNSGTSFCVQFFL